MDGWSMMNRFVELPPAASTKLNGFVLSKIAAEDAGRSAAQRLDNLPRDIDPQMISGLAAQRDKENHRHGQLAQLVSRINQWVSQLKPGTVLEMAPTTDVQLKNGETVSGLISAIRTQVASTRAHLNAVRTSPLPQADQLQLAETFVLRQAQLAWPNVAIVGDELRFTPKDNIVGAMQDVGRHEVHHVRSRHLARAHGRWRQSPTPERPTGRLLTPGATKPHQRGSGAAWAAFLAAARRLRTAAARHLR
jgi:hypothetical protein